METGSRIPDRIGFRIGLKRGTHPLVLDGLQNALMVATIPALVGKDNPGDHIRSGVAISRNHGFVWIEVGSIPIDLPEDWHATLTWASEQVLREGADSAVASIEALPADFEWPFDPAPSHEH